MALLYTSIQKNLKKANIKNYLTQIYIKNYLLNNIEVGHGKLVTFYVDHETGDIVVQNNGFEYYTTEEVDNLFTIGLEEVPPAEDNILKSFRITQGLQQNQRVVGTFNIPRDFLLKNVSIETARAGNSQNIPAGHKYFDFTFNTKNSNANATVSHIYLDVNDLVDVYTADNTTLLLNNQNVFSIKDVPSSLISDINSLSNRLNLNDKVDKEQGKGLSEENFTTAEKTKLANIEAQANKITVDNSLQNNSQNPVSNSKIYQALTNINSDYIYIDKLGNIHSLQYKPYEINLSFSEGMLVKEVIGKTFVGDDVTITDAYVDIYDSATDEYILTLTNEEEAFEELEDYETIYGKIRDIISDNVLVEVE